MIIIYTPTGRSTKTHNQCVIRNQDLWLQPATHRYRIDITLIATGHEDGEMWHPGNEYLVWVYMCSSNLELLCILLHICIIMCIIYIYIRIIIHPWLWSYFNSWTNFQDPLLYITLYNYWNGCLLGGMNWCMVVWYAISSVSIQLAISLTYPTVNSRSWPLAPYSKTGWYITLQ